TQSGTCRNDGKAPGKGRSPPDVGDDKLPPWRENSLKKRAKVMDEIWCPWKNGMSPGSDGEIILENVNRSRRLPGRMETIGQGRRGFIRSRRAQGMRKPAVQLRRGGSPEPGAIPRNLASCPDNL
ncbi:MAG: hypothetical protein IMZ53_08200, partial [Thermoplasmata archaeon]|nr:hypothetical protein [Thermoplasmata archaeon]